jgi:hypothetical protein
MVGHRVRTGVGTVLATRGGGVGGLVGVCDPSLAPACARIVSKCYSGPYVAGLVVADPPPPPPPPPHRGVRRYAVATPVRT